MKTLVTGKARAATAEFAYCGFMYKDSPKSSERTEVRAATGSSDCLLGQTQQISAIEDG